MYDRKKIVRPKMSRMCLFFVVLALCKLMPLDNDTCEVKMPLLEGKAWAGANGDWVV